MGEYRVISVEHHVERDDYYNHFVAVPLGMEYSLYEPKTIAYPEIAEVVANNDPKKQGRVQVRFFWQKMLAEQTPLDTSTNPRCGCANRQKWQSRVSIYPRSRRPSNGKLRRRQPPPPLCEWQYVPRQERQRSKQQHQEHHHQKR